MNADQPFANPGRAALDPQLDLCRDRLECSSWTAEPEPSWPSIPVSASTALLASVLACLLSINR